MDLELKDKVVIITGGAGKVGSISKAILDTLVNEGAIIAILDINDRGKHYEVDYQSKGKPVWFFKTDLLEETKIEDSVKKVAHKLGRIDVVINNVGINDGVGIEGKYKDFLESLKLNLVSYWLVVKFALPFLKKSKGNIINIGSKVALTGQGGTSAYAASKGGVLGLTREWAVDLIPYEIRVNAILISECWTPSYNDWIETIDNGQEKLERIKNNIPLNKRMTTPQEIANTVSFVASNKSSHTTGQFVFVDGGYVHLDRALLSNK